MLKFKLCQSVYRVLAGIWISNGDVQGHQELSGLA